MIETELTMEEKQEDKNTKIHGKMEKDEGRKCLWDGRELVTPHGVWSSSKISEMTATWELSNYSRWDLMLRGSKPHKHLT